MDHRRIAASGSNLTVAQATLEDRGRGGILETLSGRSKKEYAKEAEAVTNAPEGEPTANGAAADELEAVVAM